MTHQLEICSVCRRVQGKQAEWKDLWSYMDQNELPASAIILTSSYCPECDESYRLLMAYGRAGQSAEFRAL